MALAMVLAAVAPLVVTGYRAAALSNRQSVEQSEQRLERKAVQTSAEMKRWVLSHEDFLSGWMTLYPDLASISSPQQVGFLRAVYRAMPSVVSTSLVSPNGGIWVAQDGQVIAPQFLTDEEIRGTDEASRGRRPGLGQGVQLALAKRPDMALGQTQFGHVYRNDSGLTATLWTRSRTAEGPLLAVELSLDDLDALLHTDSKVVELGLLGSDGELLSGGDQDWVRPELLVALLGKTASFEYELAGVEYRGVITPVPRTSMSVVVVEPSIESEKLGRSIRNELMWTLFASLLVAILAGVLLARPLSRPIGILRTAALDVADGALGKQVDIGAGGEIGELSDAFNYMSKTLESNRDMLASQRAEIEAFNRELQQRVEERTRDLQAAQKDLVRTGQLAAVAEVGAGLAHELNNPLAGILGISQVLKMKMGDSPEGALLSQVEAQTIRCREVVDAMLRLSARTEGEPDGENTSLRVLLEEVVGMSEASFRQRGVSLEFYPCEDDVVAFVPTDQMIRILNQVLQSMRAGLSSGAKLALSASLTREGVEVLFAPDQIVAAGDARDDWMASGAALWVARQMLDKFRVAWSNRIREN